MDDEAINTVIDAALEIPAVRSLLQDDSELTLFMQINAGRSQLTHLLIDLGMTADARRGLE